MKYAVKFYRKDRMRSLVEDTDPIGKKRAVKLFNEHLGEFYKNLESTDKCKMQLSIWEDVGDDNPNYHKAWRELDSDDYELTRGIVCRIDTELPELDTLSDHD